MKPSIPCSWFDMALIPEHDRCYSLSNVVRTEVALCPLVLGATKERDLGVILIGGESRHYGWDEERLTHAISQIVTTGKHMRWEIFDSRRTSDGYLNRLQVPGLVVRNHCQDIPTDYLSNCLARASIGWVTSDSVSMVHEAIANRLQVGIIDMPLRHKRRRNKIRHAIEQLVNQGLVDRDLPLPIKDSHDVRNWPDYNLKYARLIYDRLL